MKIKQLITHLLKYNPNAEVRYLTSGCVGNQLTTQYSDQCVYICDADDKDTRLSNPADSQVLAR